MAIDKQRAAELLSQSMRANSKMSKAERDRRAHQRNVATSKARTALVALHPDDYRVLYQAALAQAEADA